MKNYLSIDIGGTFIKFAIIDRGGKITFSDKVASPKTLEDFKQAIDQIIVEYKDECRAVAFSSPGKIDSENGIVYFGGGLPYLHGFGMKEYVEGTHNLPCSIINDGKAVALAEQWLGEMNGVEYGATITLGTGLGGGIILNGKLHEGATFQAGEISLMLSSCGDTLDLRDAAGYKGSAVRFIGETGHALGLENPMDGKAVFTEIHAENPEVMPLFAQYCKEIAVVIINIQTVVDIEKVAIGGGVSAQQILIDEINRQYKKIRSSNELFEMLTDVEIVACKFRNEAGLLGALYNYLLRQ